MCEPKPPVISQQCIVYDYKCDLCDAEYVGFTSRHLHQRIDEHRYSAIGKHLRAVVSNYRESADSCKNSNFFFFDQKIPLGELFSKTIFKSSSESPVWRKIEKFKIWLNLAERRVKIMQIGAFSKCSYKTRKTCFYLKLTGFVTHFLKLLSTYILSRSMLSFHSFYSRTQCSVSYFVDTVDFTVF